MEKIEVENYFSVISRLEPMAVIALYLRLNLLYG
jgi:hypothetical protein